MIVGLSTIHDHHPVHGLTGTGRPCIDGHEHHFRLRHLHPLAMPCRAGSQTADFPIARPRPRTRTVTDVRPTRTVSV